MWVGWGADGDGALVMEMTLLHYLSISWVVGGRLILTVLTAVGEDTHAPLRMNSIRNVDLVWWNRAIVRGIIDSNGEESVLYPNGRRNNGFRSSTWLYFYEKDADTGVGARAQVVSNRNADTFCILMKVARRCLRCAYTVNKSSDARWDGNNMDRTAVEKQKSRREIRFSYLQNSYHSFDMFTRSHDWVRCLECIQYRQFYATLTCHIHSPRSGPWGAGISVMPPGVVIIPYQNIIPI